MFSSPFSWASVCIRSPRQGPCSVPQGNRLYHPPHITPRKTHPRVDAYLFRASWLSIRLTEARACSGPQGNPALSSPSWISNMRHITPRKTLSSSFASGCVSVSNFFTSSWHTKRASGAWPSTRWLHCEKFGTAGRSRGPAQDPGHAGAAVAHLQRGSDRDCGGDVWAIHVHTGDPERVPDSGAECADGLPQGILVRI